MCFFPLSWYSLSKFFCTFRTRKRKSEKRLILTLHVVLLHCAAINLPHKLIIILAEIFMWMYFLPIYCYLYVCLCIVRFRCRFVYLFVFVFRLLFHWSILLWPKTKTNLLDPFNWEASLIYLRCFNVQWSIDLQTVQWQQKQNGWKRNERRYINISNTNENINIRVPNHFFCRIVHSHEAINIHILHIQTFKTHTKQNTCIRIHIEIPK